MPTNFLIPQTRINNLVANLQTLQSNIDAIQLDLQDLHDTITQEIGQAITDLQGLISTETTRATTAEGTKVDKVSTANQIYGTDSSGNQTTYTNSLFVHTSGNETVGGVKTFTSTPVCYNTGTGNGQITLKNSVTTYGDSSIDLVQATSNSKNQFLVHFKEGNKWVTNWDQDPTSKNVTVSFRGCSAAYTPTPTENTTSSTQIDTVGARNTALGNKVDKVSTANRVYGTDGNGAQTTYDKNSFGQVDDVKVGTTSVVSNKVATLGTMAGETATNYATVTSLNNKIQKVTTLPSTQETGVLYCIPE